MLAFTNGRVLVDGKFIEDHVVLVDAGHIVAVSAEAPPTAGIIDLQGRYLAPGFIDTQVNGGGNRLFNDDPSVATISAIGEAHRRFGTTSFLPTLISDDIDKIEAAMEAVRTAIAEKVPGVAGVHIEGPFLNVARKGIHDAAKLRPISEREIELLSRPTGGKTMVTLAPETVPPQTISRLANAGVIVSAGHTEATADCIEAALANGLRGFTHLFNAMSQLTPREPGVVGAALADEQSWCGIIVDGHHVDPRTLTLALRASPLRRFMLVTDAMPSVGGDKSFQLNGEAIKVEAGRCANDAGTLAGSDLDMATAVRNAVSMLGLELADAIGMATSNPAAFLGLEKEVARIAPGYRADFVLLNDALEVVETWISGDPNSAD